MRTVVRTLRLAGLLACAFLASPLAAQEGYRANPEARGLDFRPDGGFRKQARQVRQGRRAALARGDLRFLNSPGAAAVVTGDYKLPVVFLEFSDTVAAGIQLDTAAYGRRLFGANPGADGKPYSVKTFYEEISNGNITIDGNVFGWIHPPAQFTKLFVGQNCHGVSGITANCTVPESGRLGAWFVNGLDSLNTAGRQVDWSQFDSDGDGVVDFVIFIHPTKGGECQGSQASDIWAHRYYLSALRGSAYVTKTPWPGHPGQFIRVDDYIIQSSLGGDAGCTTTEMMPIGTVSHETGHAFGIPDLYDTSAPQDEGIGEWGLMGSGNYTMPYSPSGFEAWSLSEMGWVAVANATTGSVTLGPVQTADTILRVPLSGTDEFLLLENRQSRLSDTAQMNLVATPHGKSPGLLIWHIDQSIVDAGRANNSVNAGATKGTYLVQADGQNNLQLTGVGRNRGDRGDPFPGSSNVTAATPTTAPSLTSYNGRVGRSITAITQVTPNGPMSFTLSPSQFKVLVGIGGAGTVTNSGGGSVTAGVFIDSAGVTTVIAHPSGGAAFTGWSGDTTGSDTVMVLPMRRPYNLTASFTGAVAVSYDQATDAILGITPLASDQATYLDAVGNNNAVYDLGDYLAFLKANGVVASPQVLQRVLRGRTMTTRKEN